LKILIGVVADINADAKIVAEMEKLALRWFWHDYHADSSPSIDLDYHLNQLHLEESIISANLRCMQAEQAFNVSRVLTMMKVNNVAMVPWQSHGDFFLNAAEAEKLKLEILQ
jgi:hypothetical protein